MAEQQGAANGSTSRHWERIYAAKDTLPWDAAELPRRHLERFRSGLLQASLVLDVGCGSGRVAEWLLGQAPDLTVVGVDISMTAIRRNRARLTSSLSFVGDGLAAGRDGCADGVLMIGLAHHLEDDRLQAMLEDARRVLRPGRCILIGSQLPSSGEPEAGWSPTVSSVKHLRPARDLRALMRASGFGPVDEQTLVLGDGLRPLTPTWWIGLASRRASPV